MPRLRARKLHRELHTRGHRPLNLRGNRVPIIPPNLADSQHEIIRDMILSKLLTSARMADAAGCSIRSIKRIRSNPCSFGATKAPSNGVGRRRSITPPILDTLHEYLLEKPELYLGEMAVFLWDEFEVLVTTPTISRTFPSIR